MELTKAQQEMFNAASASNRAHLTLYGFTVTVSKKPYKQIVISNNKGDQLILRAVN